MRNPRLVLVLSLAASACRLIAQEPAAVPQAVPQASAPDPFDPVTTAPRSIRVLVESIEISHEALTRLLLAPENPDPGSLRKRLQEMIGNNEAKVMETQLLTTHSGEKAVSNSIHEFIYPVEFTPAAMEKKMAEIIAPGPFPANPAIPTAFETRNLGSTLEIEPTLGADGKTIDLRLAPEIIWHSGKTVYHQGRDSAGYSFEIAMPDFYRINFSSRITCAAGRHILATVQSPMDSKGNPDLSRKIVVLVKCDVLPLE